MSRAQQEQSMSTDSFSDGAPSSDSDPYQNDTNPTTTYNIDASNFPRPVPIFNKFFGFEKAYATTLQKRLEDAGKLLNRPVTQDEATAFAYYTSKQMAIISYGQFFGIAGGFWRCYGTADTLRFPFWQPNMEKLTPDKFPSPRLALFTGGRAAVCWHIMRAMAYGTMGNIIGGILSASYGATVTVVGELSDPRMKAYIDAAKEDAKKRRGLPDSRPQAQRGPQPQGGSVPIGGMNQPDDASPSGGMYGQADMTPSPGTYDPTPQPQPQTRSWPPARPTPQQTPYEDTQAKPFDMFDDASPTGGQGMAEDTRTVQTSGSAWERLRRGENPAAIPSKTTRSQPQIQAQREQQQQSDGYTMSKSDEERSYAKEEAQKEFDARIERERRGGDFNAGGGNKKW